MVFGNPTIKYLRYLIAQGREFEAYLTILRSGDVTSDRSKELFRKLHRILEHILYYSKKELLEFRKHKLGIQCKEILIEIREETQLISQCVNKIRSREKLEQAEFEKIRWLIEKIREIESLFRRIEMDVKFQNKQELLAKKKAKQQLSLQEQGCHHVSSDFLSVIGTGIFSQNHAKERFGEEVFLGGIDPLQGDDYISVWDPYTYWKLYLFFEKNGYLDMIKKEERITKEALVKALEANPDLNLSRHVKDNLDQLNFGRNEEIPLHYVGNFLRNSMALIHWVRSYPPRYFSPHNSKVIILIDDTIPFFPSHGAAWEFEGVFAEKVDPDKIAGLIIPVDFSTEGRMEAEEASKYMGLPLYDFTGKLLWPTK